MNYYIHTPFCRSKCGYCAFYSEPAPNRDQIRRWLDRLEKQIQPSAPGTVCESIYLGGGTPTLLAIEELERLLNLLERFAPSPATEISIEANPETLDAEKVALLRSHVNRISLGVQSFQQTLRDTLGRNCTQSALEQAIDLIQAAQFPHWNIDLIYAIPGQTPDSWRAELRQAAALGCDHVSCYNLTPEEGARLSSQLIPDEDDALAMWNIAAEELAPNGIHRYEISNYARHGAECRHNQNVWCGGKLQSYGPSAAGFDGCNRLIEPASLNEWLAGIPPEIDTLSPRKRCSEIFAVNLRTTRGWTPALWSKVPAADAWECRQQAIRRASQETSPDFFDISPERITLSAQGLLFWNTIAEALL